MIGVKSGTEVPVILAYNCFHVFVFLSWSGRGPGCSKGALVIQGLSNLLMFILTFDQDFNLIFLQQYKSYKS